MTDVATAAAVALRAAGGYVLVSGRTWAGLEPLAAAADHHLVVPAPEARVAVVEGLRLGGRRGVAVLTAAPLQPPADQTVAVTTDVACARRALDAGWSVAQPAAADDVEQLLRRANVLLVGPALADGPDEPAGALTRSRTWREGPMATLVASGAAVSVLRRLSDRLATRGVEVTAVELAVAHLPAHAPLLGGTSLGVAGPGAAEALRGGGWDDGFDFVASDGADDAELVGAILARVPASASG